MCVSAGNCVAVFVHGWYLGVCSKVAGSLTIESTCLARPWVQRTTIAPMHFFCPCCRICHGLGSFSCRVSATYPQCASSTVPPTLDGYSLQSFRLAIESVFTMPQARERCHRGARQNQKWNTPKTKVEHAKTKSGTRQSQQWEHANTKSGTRQNRKWNTPQHKVEHS